MIFFETAVEAKPEYYSVSRLKSYSQCSMYYKLKYVDKIKVVSMSESTITGNLCHDALEFYYGEENYHGLSLLECLEVTGKKTLIERCGFKNLAKADFDKLYKDLLFFAQDSLLLYIRASDWYTGDNPIRTKQGKVAKAPSKTSGWIEVEQSLGLTKKRRAMQEYYERINPEFKDILLANAFAQAYYICLSYRQPEELIEVLVPEMALSDYKVTEEGPQVLNPVPMPEEFGGKEGVYLNGYIDVVGLVKYKGKVRKAIIDYKSNKDDFTQEEVDYNVQLFSYVYAYEYLTGEKLDVMGIFNLRTNNLVLVEIDREIMQDMLEALFSTHKAIKAEVFKKHIPDSSYAQCLNSYGKLCPYLGNCHPKLYEQKVGKSEERIDQEYAELLQLVS